MTAPTRRQHHRQRDSRARAAEAYEMHLDGDTWQEIADALGFRSRQGAQSAVNRHLAETTTDPDHIKRRKWADAKHRLRRRLCRQMTAAEDANDSQAVAQLSREIDRVDDQIAKASGYYAPQRVDVSVDAAPSMVAAEWLRQVHAAAAVSGGHPAALPSPPVVDAEVIP